MSDDYKIQVNLKTGPGHEATLINVRGDNPGEITSILDWVITNAPQFKEAEQALQAVSAVAAAFPGSQVTQTQAAPQQQGWGNDGYQQQPAFAPQQQAAPAAPQGPAPSCVHGPMQYRDGSKVGKSWKAYMCPAPKGANQCQPQWIK